LSKQSVTVALNGYVPQTLAVDVLAKDFDPNPVQVTLQAVHPKSHRPKPAKTATSSGPGAGEDQAPTQAPAQAPPPPVNEAKPLSGLNEH
jgi:hypothetical protein